MPMTLDLPTFNILSRASALCGADIQGALQHCDMSVSAEGTAFSKLDIGVILQLLTQLDSSATGGHLPFAMADVFQFDGLPEVSAFLVSSEHLRQAQILFEWIPSIIHPALRLEYIDEQNTAATHIHIDGQGAGHDVFIEVVTAIATRITYNLAPHLGGLLEVYFQHAPRADIEQYQAFFRCPLQFHQASNLVRIPSQALDQPLPGSLPLAHEQAEASIRQKLISDSAEPTLEEQIRNLLLKRYELFGQGIDAMAKALHLHPRALQRQLKTQGLRYSTILAATRYQLACKMLAETDLDIESIGYKLGYQERRSFTQAFRKASGYSPAIYRSK